MANLEQLLDDADQKLELLRKQFDSQTPAIEIMRDLKRREAEEQEREDCLAWMEYSAVTVEQTESCVTTGLDCK